MNLHRKFAIGSLLLGLIPLLAGCFGVAAVGVGSGALMLADRRPSEIYIADEATEVRGNTRLNEKFGDRAHINLTSYDRTVLMTGEVSDAAAKADAEKIVAALPGVKATVNELQISGLSSLGSRSNDGYITSKVKARFVDHGRFPANLVKVVTEAGTVYLIGMVTRSEADAAVDIARTTGGVLKVVRVFEVISDDDARRIDNRPANTAPAAGK